MKSLSKANKIIVSMISAFCAIALVVGLTFCFVNLTPKKEENIQTSQAKTQPDNTSYYWDEAHDAGLVKLNFNWKGSGTSSDPWLISNAEDLAGLSYVIYKNTDETNSYYEYGENYYYSEKYFKQTCNIDVSRFWWQPIGIKTDRNWENENRFFAANYNGDGHHVSGIFTKTYDYQGLFGKISVPYEKSRVIIKNLAIINSVIQGCNYVGAIAGDAGYYSRKSVEILNCYNTSNITGSYSAGGIVGAIGDGIMQFCYNTGHVEGSVFAGGIAYAIGYYSSVKDCFNVANVIGKSAGGICMEGGSYVTNCYYGGECTLKNGVLRGTDYCTFISNLNTTEYAKNYGWFNTGGGAIWSGMGTWDFYNGVWQMNAKLNDGYPIFKNQYLLTLKIDPNGGSYEGSSKETSVIKTIGETLYLTNPIRDGYKFDGWSLNGGGTLSGSTYTFGDSNGTLVAKWVLPTWIDFAARSFGGGTGSQSNPYKIASAEQLAKLAKDVNNSVEYSGVYFEQTANIDLGDYNWIPIGDNPNYAFKGIYNGAFYSINNINSVEIGSNDKSGGLFGYVNNAKLMNIIMVDGSVEGGRDTGAICGENDGDSSIKNCIVENISISMKYGNASVGGIVGRFTGGTVESCIVKNCVISSGGTVGGICGWRSTIKDCAVINCIINKGWSNTCDTALGWGENSTTVSSFAVATCDGTAKKIMYGNTSAWGNWGLAPSVNNDYPIQNSLFALGGFSTSQEVYNKLIALGFICN